MKMLARVALAGFSGVLLWRVLGLLFVPMVSLLLKPAMITLLGYAVLTLFKRSRRRTEDNEDESVPVS